MKPEIKRVVAAKTMRVATTFTGAAACAFAFTPAALAGTHLDVAGAGQQAHDNGVRPDAITTKNHCPGGTSNWLHLAYTTGGDICYGGSGTLEFTNSVKINSFCGGNNTGVIYGYSKDGGSPSIPFGHGTFYAKIPSRPYAVWGLSMDGWKGNDKCGPP
jgi:hypothetical protein